ncbi:hypothetical protein PG991_005537 [Apiospora marii]|uniref:Uncharacterized protein n=1 Tax=Apiospora marii TaxID=335849 RepID=A0ABR1S9I3_9PEZI
MPNETTGSFKTLWEVATQKECFTNNTNPRLDTGLPPWSNSPDGYASRLVELTSQLPDIEATVTSCREPDEENSVAIRITDVRKTYSRGEDCPVIDTNAVPAKCAFNSVAKELAARVSDEVLNDMRCNRGEWQTITAPCQSRQNYLAPPQHADFGMGLVTTSSGACRFEMRSSSWSYLRCAK